MFARRYLTMRLVLVALALMFLTAPFGSVHAMDPLASQTYESTHGFWAYPSTYPILFAKPGAPCYGMGSCYIDSYLLYYAPWGNYWVYGVDYGTQFINLFPDGSVVTSWARGNHNSLIRWANGPCAGRGSNCVFMARRDYVNSNRQQREEVFAYGSYWIFDLTVSDGNRVLASGPTCDANNPNSYVARWGGGDPRGLPSNVFTSCGYNSNVLYVSPSSSRPRP